MQYIITMSLAGSLMLAASMVLWRWEKGRVSSKTIDVLLKFSIFYYVVPLVFLEPTYRDLSYCLPFEPQRPADGISAIVYMKEISGGTTRINGAYGAQIAAVLVWGLVAAGILGIRIVGYMVKRRRLTAKMQRITDEEVLALSEKVRREYRIRRHILLYDVKGTALTTGILRPVILLDAQMPAEQMELTIRHECMHIKRLDVLTRQLATFVVCLHWFNPLSYLLRRKLEWISEICCDERAVRDVGKEKRAVYAKMLLENMQEAGLPSFAFTTLTRQGKAAEERIRLIMKPKKSTKTRKILVGLLAGAMIFLDSLTVFAYPKVTVVWSEDASEQAGYDFSPNVKGYFSEDGAKNPYMTFVILYDEQFTDEEGNIYPVEETVSVEETHTHSWISGIYRKHELTTGGGCITLEYDAERCFRCGTVQIGEWVNTHMNTNCPH